MNQRETPSAIVTIVGGERGRRSDEGVTGRAQYGVTKYGDNEEYLVGLAAGIKLGDRGNFVIGGEYAKSNGATDQFNRPWAREQSALLTLSSNRPVGTPANIFAKNVQSAIPAGGLITSCVQGTTVQAGGACPIYGTTFNNNGQPGAFEFGSLVGSTTMLGGGNEFHHPEHYVNLRQAYNRWAVMGMLTYELSDSITAHLDVMGGSFNNKSQSVFYISQANSIRINRDNPFIPTSLAAQMDAAGITQIRMARQNEDRGGIKPDNESSYYQAAFGLEGSIFENWSWDATASYGRSSFTYSASDFMILPNYWSALHAVRDGSGNIVCGSLDTNPMAANISATQRPVIQPGCVPFNPFGASRSDQLPGVYDYIYGTSSRTEVFKRFNAQINLAGSPFSTWAGPVSVATGYEHRQDRVTQTIPADIAALSAGGGFFATNFLPGSGKVSVNEGYVEVGVPLLDDSSGIGTLDLNSAVRYTDYSTSGSVTTWKAGLVFEPIDAIRFRGTYSRDIRAPNIPELAIPGLEGLATFTRPDTLVTAGVRTQQVSNPNLRPEKANTFTVGVVLQPGGALDGLRLSVDYFDIRIDDVIASLSAYEVIQRRFGRGDTSFDSFITYDNSAIGISKVGSPLLNLNSQTTRGVDMELNYRFPDFGIGRLMLQANATYTSKLETKTCHILTASACKLVPYENHGDAPSESNQDYASHILGLIAQKDDCQREHECRSNQPVLNER